MTNQELVQFVILVLLISGAAWNVHLKQYGSAVFIFGVFLVCLKKAFGG